MLDRRLIRIKTFKVVFAAHCSEEVNLDSAQKELLHSCSSTLDLYYFLLNICGSLSRLALEKIEAGKSKFHPTEKEANPSYKFVNNIFAEGVDNDFTIQNYCAKKGLKWGAYDGFLRKLYSSIVESDYYRDYMESGAENNLKEDCALYRHIFEEEFEDNEMLASLLEDFSATWLDDLNYVLNFILSTVDTYSSRKSFTPQKVFLKEDGETFAKRLLSASLIDYDKYFEQISATVKNWESDRLSRVDVTLIVMGLAEASSFENIPVKVTINEYVEISKYYSGEKSHIFVNGLLDKMLKDKLASGEIRKCGAGLLTD